MRRPVHEARGAEVEAVRIQELRRLTDEEGAMAADDLLQLLALLPVEPDRRSGWSSSNGSSPDCESDGVDGLFAAAEEVHGSARKAPALLRHRWDGRSRGRRSCRPVAPRARRSTSSGSTG